MGNKASSLVCIMGMKALKICIVVLLFLLGFMITSERYQQYLSQFQSFYSISFSCEDSDALPQLLSDLQAKQSEFDIGLFYTVTEYSGEYDSNVTIYCSDNVKRELIEEYRYVPGTTRSVFFGNTIIMYKNLSDLPYETFKDTRCSGHVYGNFDTLVAFKADLVDQYGGSFPKAEGTDELKAAKISVVITWVIIVTILLSLTYYTRLTGRKEDFVRFSVGDSLLRNAVFEMTIDIVIYLVVFAAESIYFRYRIGHIFLFKGICVIILFLFILNSALHLSLPFTQFRFAVSNASISEKMVGVCGCYHVIILVLLLLLASTSITSFVEYRKINDQEWFYNKYRGYRHVSFVEKDFAKSVAAEEKFYSEYFDKYDICVAIGLVSADDSNVYVLNNNMRWYLQFLLEDIPESSAQILCFYREDVSKETVEQLICPVELLVYGAEEDAPILYIPYSKNIKVIDQDDERYELLENPIILFNPCHEFDPSRSDQDEFSLRLYRYYINCTKDELDVFADENDIKYNSSGVYEEFDHYRTTLRRVFATSAVFAIGLFVLGCILSTVMVRFEFEARKMEIVLLKTMGIPMWYRYRRLFLLTIASGLFGIGVAYGTSLVVSYGNRTAIVLCGGGIIAIDLLILAMLCRKNEIMGVNRTLKNG